MQILDSHEIQCVSGGAIAGAEFAQDIGALSSTIYIVMTIGQLTYYSLTLASVSTVAAIPAAVFTGIALPGAAAYHLIQLNPGMLDVLQYKYEAYFV